MGEKMQISEKTRCWICDRNSRELKKIVETYWESGELGKDMGLDACFKIIDVEKVLSEEKIPIPICTICYQLVLQYIRTYLRNNMEITIEL